MPITEFATLELISPYTLSLDIIRNLFETLSGRQSAYSTFPLYFFTDIADASVIYLISGWNDVDVHMRWIESDGNQELVKAFAPYLKVKALLHLDIDFSAIPEECPVVVIQRLGVTPLEHVDSSWVGTGKDLEPGSEMSYRLSVYEKVEEMGLTQASDIAIMQRIVQSC